MWVVGFEYSTFLFLLEKLSELVFDRLEDFIEGQHHLFLGWLLRVRFFLAFIPKQSSYCRFVLKFSWLSSYWLWTKSLWFCGYSSSEGSFICYMVTEQLIYFYFLWSWREVYKVVAHSSKWLFLLQLMGELLSVLCYVHQN